MLKYTGKGFLRGVPARDLKDYEVARYGYSYLVRSGLYVPEKQVTEVKTPDIVDDEPAQKQRKRRKIKGD